MWCATSYSLVDAILKDRRFGRVMPGARRDIPAHLDAFYHTETWSLLNLEPPQHTRLRSRVNHAFVARRIRALEHDITMLAQNCIQTLQRVSQADLLPHYATPIPATIIARMIGVPESRIHDLLDWSHAMVKVYTMTQTHEDELQADAAATAFTHYLTALIEERRDSAEDDLLSHLIHTPEDAHLPPLTQHELVCITVLLLNAGHEATVHQIGNALKTLLEYDDDISALFIDQEQTRATVTELMRYDAPLHFFTRFLLTDLTIDDVPFKAGDEIGLCLGAANLDPQRFTNADVFNPFRSDGGNLSFGAGVHFCIGAQLAKLELGISLPLVFEKLPGLRLTDTPRYKNSFHFHGLESLPVAWQAQ